MRHAMELLPVWLASWKASGGIILLLDFDGTLAPIVEHRELAAILPAARPPLEQLSRAPGVELAIISGRGLDDVRDRVGLSGIHYAGNHGMQIEGPRLSLTQSGAQKARPLLLEAAGNVSRELADIPGTEVEDKGLTLTVHFRRADEAAERDVRAAVTAAVGGLAGLTVTEGKKVLEIRPTINWGKGETVDLLLQHLERPSDTPVIYIGDDVTDEGAFQAAERYSEENGFGVLVAPAPGQTSAATSYLDGPNEVAHLLTLFVQSPRA